MRVWHIVVREYLENVRTKAFLLGIVLTPIWFGIAFFVPRWIEQAEVEARRVVIVDETGTLAEPLEAALRARQTSRGKPLFVPEVLGPAEARVDDLRAEAAEGKLIVVLLSAAAMYLWYVWLDVIYAVAAIWLLLPILLASRRFIEVPQSRPAKAPRARRAAS